MARYEPSQVDVITELVTFQNLVQNIKNEAPFSNIMNLGQEKIIGKLMHRHILKITEVGKPQPSRLGSIITED